MRRLVAVAAIVALLLGGCAATQQEMADYYDTINTGNRAIIASIEKQGDLNRIARTQQMTHFSSAMSSAAATPSLTDDVTIAFAWGYLSGQPLDIEVPDIKFPAKPVTDVDRVRAWTPVIGMAVPFLYPLVYNYANDGSGSGTTIRATDDATVLVGSQNPGSYNKVGGDYANSSSTLNSTCVTGDCAEEPVEGEEGEVNPLTGEPTQLPTECSDYPDAFYGSGTWWINSDATCSCESREAGRC